MVLQPDLRELDRVRGLQGPADHGLASASYAAFVMRLQRFAADHGYKGPIDGNSNAACWAGVQSGLGAYGYTGPINGLPGANTYKAFQRLAAAYGYSGPVNGILGPNSFRGFATFLNQAC